VHHQCDAGSTEPECSEEQDEAGGGGAAAAADSANLAEDRHPGRSPVFPIQAQLIHGTSAIHFLAVLCRG